MFTPLLGALLSLTTWLPVCAQDQGHWAFLEPKHTPTPVVKNRAWPRTAIDAFILAGLEEFGLRPSIEAGRHTLLRRLSFDLTGIPPSLEMQQEFAADERPDAYERLVDRLLASPAFGERWGQHWLDLARYADTDGFEYDGIRADAWRYRDWVVRALNADMPYDQFLHLQVAGDEDEPRNIDAFIATGFNRCYPDMVDQNDQNLRRQNALNDITETTSLVFLGLTMGCARCHDHKTDPIPQADFYRLQAFFSAVRFRDDLPILDPTELEHHARLIARWQNEIREFEAQVPSAVGPARDALLRRLDALRKNKPGTPQARGIDEEPISEPPATYVWLRGEFGARGVQVEPAVPSALRLAGPSVQPTTSGSGRRTALARWLTRDEHPLTSRVIVNRLWQHYFGRGLVATPSDFGLAGDPTSHPELLDRLAIELVKHGWSLKHLHRMIVLSSTYRQSAALDSKAADFDPENTLLWRHSRRRLDGEEIRDAMLSASGLLQSNMGGPGVFPDLPQELARLNAQGVAWPVSKNSADHVRRSLYIFVRRNLRFPLFEAFDRPDTNASCARRPATTTAPQALSLLNGSLVIDAAHALANRAAIECGNDQKKMIAQCFALVLNRPVTVEELCIADKLFPSRLLGDLCLALFNTNAFLYLD